MIGTRSPTTPSRRPHKIFYQLKPPTISHTNIAITNVQHLSNIRSHTTSIPLLHLINTVMGLGSKRTLVKTRNKTR